MNLKFMSERSHANNSALSGRTSR